MAFSFKGWIFRQLPYRYKDEDTNKNLDGKGTFERYLNNFEDDIDENIYPFIRDFMDIFDILTVEAKYLPYISYYLGEPPSADGSVDTYRKILANAVKIYKIKGTEESYKLLFNLYGLDVQIIEAIPRRSATYDQDNVKYDDGWTYDLTCEYCSCYWIVYKPITQPDNPTSVNLAVPLDIINLINKIVCFIQPINANLCGVYHKITFADEIEIDFEESTDVLLPDRVPYVNFLEPLAGTPDDQDIIDAYTIGESNWDSDLDQILAALQDAGAANAMRFYVAKPDGSTVLSDWIYGVPITDVVAVRKFITKWFSLNVGDSSLEQSGDHLYPAHPDGNVYLTSAISDGPTTSENKILIGFDTLLPLTGCPTPAYPLGIYGVDDTAIGVAADAAEVVKIWNSYIPNKAYGYLEHTAGCTFKLTHRTDEDDIMPGEIKATILTIGENGDFNEDFTINPGGDFF